jgi:hypothetical protein
MKIILQTKEDVFNLTGKWIIQVNSDEPNLEITEKNWAFLCEKRIMLAIGLQLVGLWYLHSNFDTWEDLAFRINHYVKGDGENTRFHRLLTNRELDFLNKKFKEKQND